ncbi:bacterial transcriptional activator domain-containing protein [Inquilinus limosus]|uniref:AfsR/SARP family transcriptional regulator n=1 Tax=Inquilinus limosus TaxID=171674 RepID=UPI003F176BFC
MATWGIYLLGRERFSRSDVGVIDMPEVWWLVLSCLLVSPGWCLGRSAIAGRLWPEQYEHAARHCLATALWRIKCRLPKGQELLVQTAGSVKLSVNRTVWIDIFAFERRARLALTSPDMLSSELQRRRLARALQLYRGSLLGDRDSEWIAIERERLRALYLDALFALATAEARAGDWVSARQAAQTLCAAEPLREDAQRLLMTAHARCGNRALALDQYRALAALLQSELGIGPMSETRALAAEIAGKETAPGCLESAPASMRHRDAMLQVRRHLVESVHLLDQSLGT